MLCSSMSVEGWGGVELPLAGLTPALYMRNTLSVDTVLVALAAYIPSPPVLLFMMSMALVSCMYIMVEISVLCSHCCGLGGSQMNTLSN